MTYMDAFREFLAASTSGYFYYIYHITFITIWAIIDPMLLGYYIVGWMSSLLIFSYLYWRRT